MHAMKMPAAHRPTAGESNAICKDNPKGTDKRTQPQSIHGGRPIGSWGARRRSKAATTTRSERTLAVGCGSAQRHDEESCAACPSAPTLTPMSLVSHCSALRSWRLSLEVVSKQRPGVPNVWNRHSVRFIGATGIFHWPCCITSVGPRCVRDACQGSLQTW